MDIARLSTELADRNVKDQVGTAVLGMALSAVKDDAAALAKIMEIPSSATDPDLGNRIDLLA